jgi:hypothetical protein
MFRRLASPLLNGRNHSRDWLRPSRGQSAAQFKQQLYEEN